MIHTQQMFRKNHKSTEVYFKQVGKFFFCLLLLLLRTLTLPPERRVEAADRIEKRRGQRLRLAKYFAKFEPARPSDRPTAATPH